MATDFVLMNRRTFGIRTAALCFAAGMMVSPFSLAAEEPLLKIGVLVTISVRRVKLAFASACPEREVFELAARRL